MGQLEAVFILMAVEQGKLLVAMHDIDRVVGIECASAVNGGDELVLLAWPTASSDVLLPA